MTHEHITPDLDRIKLLVTKVNELVKRGVDGEKQAAQKKLEKLLKKYGIDINDINNDDKHKRIFRIKNREDYLSILVQVIWDIVPRLDVVQNTKRLEIYCNLTNEQYIEVKEKFESYWNLWFKEKEQFMLAFIIKNNLGVGKGNSSKDAKPMSKEMTDGIRDKMDGVASGNYVSKNKKLIK